MYKHVLDYYRYKQRKNNSKRCTNKQRMTYRYIKVIDYYRYKEIENEGRRG